MRFPEFIVRSLRFMDDLPRGSLKRNALQTETFIGGIERSKTVPLGKGCRGRYMTESSEKWTLEALAEALSRRAGQGVFAFNCGEGALSAQEIGELELDLGLAMPTEWRHYLQRFGGGPMGYLDVLYQRGAGEYSVRSAMELFREKESMPIAADGCGGYFLLVGSVKGDSVTIAHFRPEDSHRRELPYRSVTDFLADHILHKNPARS